MRAGIIQLCSGDDLSTNVDIACNLIRQAVAEGSDIVFTPEVTNFLSSDRAVQSKALTTEENDQTLKAFQDLAFELGVWLNIGSLALLSELGGDKFSNRSFLIRPDGSVAARYDKIHLFDVEISESVSLKESEAYLSGQKTVVCDLGLAKLGLTICYDLRFPALYRDLAQAGADILTCPSAFTVPSGKAHWHVLLRARAIETGSFVIAAAQSGRHPMQSGSPRESYGHSLVVDPWGEVILDAGTEVGAYCVDLDLGLVEKTRKRIPSLYHDRDYDKPINV